MKNKRVVYQNAEGGLSILMPNEKCGFTLEEIIAKDVPNGVAYEILDASDIPADRENRHAWKLDGKKIVIDETKVKK